MSGYRKNFLSSIFLYMCLKIHHIYAQTNMAFECNKDAGNYRSNSKFEANLNTILSSVSKNVNIYGFYNDTEGDGVDQVNAIALCRGDINIESCREVVGRAAYDLISLYCTTEKEAIIWYDEGMFRYSKNMLLGVVSIDPLHLVDKNASNVTYFSGELSSLADNLVDQAYNGSFLKFARNEISHPNAQPVYGFMQCTPDLTPYDCKTCLEVGAKYLLNCCYNHVGASWTSPSCTFRFENNPFLIEISSQQLPPSQPPPPPPPPTTITGKSKTIIAIVCVTVALLVLIPSVCVFITKKRRQNTRRLQNLKEKLEAIDNTETRQYDFSLIRAATKDFSNANYLGSGGFGDVYKGVLSNGNEIAVKRLSTTSGQGDKEFENEVLLLARLQHICLVKLLGFCIEQKESLLVYEFMKNGSLDNFLFNEVNRSRLDWEERYKIINNIAKGLLYLHEDSRLMIIHRDLKASNILLDGDMNAKISDFGMARLFVRDEIEVITKKIAGTLGYMAPEYAMHGLFSVKSDVYSFGVLLLEIISGKKNYYSLTEDTVEGLLSYAYKTWREGRAFDLIDPTLTTGSHPLEIIMRCIHIALLCVQENVGSRPNMATIVLLLHSLTIPLPLPTEPGFFSSTMSWLSKIKEFTSSCSQSKSKSGLTNTPFDPSLKERQMHTYIIGNSC